MFRPPKALVCTLPWPKLEILKLRYSRHFSCVCKEISVRTGCLVLKSTTWHLQVCHWKETFQKGRRSSTNHYVLIPSLKICFPHKVSSWAVLLLLREARLSLQHCGQRVNNQPLRSTAKLRLKILGKTSSKNKRREKKKKATAKIYANDMNLVCRSFPV